MKSLDELTLVESEKPMNELIAILIPLLIQVESSGNINVKDGDGGKAVGILQIHKDYWKDGTYALGQKIPYARAKDPATAKRVVFAYLTRYGKHYEKTTGKKATLEVLAKVHNGGPDGWKKKATEKYWEKVKAVKK
jgi:hypothetical protein